MSKINSKKSLGKVVVAMSGGVDSSVAAALLKKQGYEVVGVFMQFWYPSGETYGENRCCSLESWHEAQEVAKLLDIEIHKVNFGREFKKTIVDEFLKDFDLLKTPNPCVACNKFIKFDLLLKYAQTVLGADYLATGHYVRLKPQVTSHKSKVKSGLELFRPKDLNKDQTYFLYNLKQPQLKNLLFPLADYKKEEIRKIAKKLKLKVHDKLDSQEICFVGKNHYDFLKRFLKLKKGKIVSDKGRVLGEHQGLPLYTLGQRSGIGLSGGPWYVVGFDKKKNQLIVSGDFSAADLLSKRVNFKSANWIAGSIKLPLKCSAQIRYRAKAENCVIKKIDSKYIAEFSKPQRAAMAGQSIVFYDGDKLLGGGIIA
ncbi:MAG: tRNA 2-thiouridine(34) synthase MnmA [Candidatus Buchananbacteria bacterium]|jgi:tRNA-specific 2-thiouridylase